MATSDRWRTDWIDRPLGMPTAPRTVEERQEWERRRAEDNSRLFDEHVAETDARLERERAALEAERLDAVRSEIRERYMQIPGATEAAFEREYPRLLADWQREQLNKPDDVDLVRAALRRDPRYARF